MVVSKLKSVVPYIDSRHTLVTVGHFCPSQTDLLMVFRDCNFISSVESYFAFLSHVPRYYEYKYTNNITSADSSTTKDTLNLHQD